MERTVNHTYFKFLIDQKGGIAKVSVKSNVSTFTIMKASNRLNPLVPKKISTRVKLAQALGVTEEELFPLIDKAS